MRIFLFHISSFFATAIKKIVSNPSRARHTRLCEKETKIRKIETGNNRAQSARPPATFFLTVPTVL